MISPGNVVGLGTGHAAAAFLEALSERVRAGLAIQGVATSSEAAQLATQLGIPLIPIDKCESIDVTVDGADEVDDRCNLIKGYGGAPVREKIVAASSRQLVILVGTEKRVRILGERGILPVEVVPFGLSLCRRRLVALGFPAEPRSLGGQLFVTDNGNVILDCKVQPMTKPADVEHAIQSIPGIVGTGLFLGMAPTVLVQKDGGIELLRP